MNDDLKKRLQLIQGAVEAQAMDGTLWSINPSIGEAYLQQSLRWLHQVIESQDMDAFESIMDQANDDL